MKKTKKKLNWVSPYRINEFESWLSYNASKGLFVKKIGKLFTEYEKADKEEMEYRVEITDVDFTFERMQMYYEAGWECVSRFNMGYIFASPKENKPIEIYTDSESYLPVVDTLRANTKGLSIALIVIAVICIIPMIYIILMGGTPYKNIVENSSPFYTIFINILLVTVGLRSFNHSYKLKKSILKNKVINHKPNWIKAYVAEVVNTGISIIILILISINFIYSISGGIGFKIVNSPDEFPENITTVNLTEVEELNYLYFSSAFYEYELAELEKRNIIATEKILDESYSSETPENMFTLFQNYYEVRFEFVAKGLIKDLMKYEESFDQNIPGREFIIERLKMNFLMKCI